MKARLATKLRSVPNKASEKSMRADIRLWTAIATDWDLRILSRSGLAYCAFLSRYGEHRFVGKAGRDHQYLEFRTGRCLRSLAS